jgi:hypothetical protein
MQKDIGKDAEGAIARRVVMLVAEDGSVELCFGGILKTFDLFFGFRGKISLQRVEISLDAVNDANRFAVLPV